MDDYRSTALDDRELPPTLAETTRTAFGLDEAPATLGDWLSSTSDRLGGSLLPVGVDELCTAEQSRHVARVAGDSQRFHCVLDALLLPFLLPGESPVAVRSRSPVSDDVVELAVSRDAVEVTPADAVMSFGLAADVDVPADGDVDPALAYEWVCPYVNAFPTRAEYDRWSASSPASTMALSFPAALELARAIADRPGSGETTTG